MSTDMWVAHDAPERPLAYGAWVCDCAACGLAIKASALRTPGMQLVVKRAMGRDVVSPADLLERGADAWLQGEDDYVREVFVRG